MSEAFYIRSASAISPQHSFGAKGRLEIKTYGTNRLAAVEPSYASLIDPKLLRRMSRIIRMGVACAMDCLQQAGETGPGAIVTGTAYGCLEDTGIFLTSLVESGEQMPPPTAFIQSTHNTVGAQIALLLKCNSYNNTFVHRGFSFESALLDAMLMLKEGEASTALAGSADELTDTSFALLARCGLYKQGEVSNRNLFDASTPGTIAGEGSAFFLLSSAPSTNDLAKLVALHTFYRPVAGAHIDQVTSFVAQQGLQLSDIGLIITGRNGDNGDDAFYQPVRELFPAASQADFKHLCGEYPTAISFGMWVAARSLAMQELPIEDAVALRTPVKYALVYNHYQGVHHSLILLSQA